MSGKITGWFEPDGTPRLDATAGAGPRGHARVSFLVSTGSPRSVIRGPDALALGLTDGSEPAAMTLAFGDGAGEATIKVEVTVDKASPGPSVLGWDILHRWDMRYDFPGGVLEFTVRTAGPDEGETPQVRFDRLAGRWRDETRFHSNPRLIRDNDAFREILEMGEDALPHIFRKLAGGESGLWWMLLERITGTTLDEGVTPVEGVPGWVKTDVETLEAAWVRWGREHGYLEDGKEETQE